MTLPFDVNNKNQRKYQCFVCGVNFSEYYEYKEHIIEKHEEGREYILCPLEYCQAPVRDMKMHFKCKHPSQKLPKTGQMRPLIWSDFKNNGKTKKNKKPKFKDGYHFSKKMSKEIHYRSGYEKTVYEQLDLWSEVAGYEAEPFEIPYIHEGKAHKYIPDIVVHYVNGKKEVWEIKPSNQTGLEKNKSKWFAAERACDNRGWEFVVITEQGISKLKNKVKLED